MLLLCAEILHVYLRTFLNEEFSNLNKDFLKKVKMQTSCKNIMVRKRRVIMAADVPDVNLCPVQEAHVEIKQTDNVSLFPFTRVRR